jgi:hypothetical protein
MVRKRRFVAMASILLGIGFVLGLVIMLGTDASARPADTPILTMHFDGDVNDSSGNGLHGTWVGTASYTTASVSGQALDLSGTNYVYTDHNDLLGGMGQVTVDVWAKKNDPDTGGQLVLKHLHYAIIVDDDDVTSYVGNTEGILGRANVYGLEAIHDTEWHHYVLAYSGSVVRLFVDDVLAANDPLTGTVRNDGGYDFYVGWSPWPSPGAGFEGQIDELLIYEGVPDIDPPTVDGHNPAPGESWVEPDADILLHVKDDGKGVVQSTIAMTVEGSLVTPTIMGTPVDYTVVYDPPSDFAYEQEVNVTIEAADVESNTVKQDYAFTIRSAADAIPPQGYFYVEDSGAVDVVVHSVIWDAESGMGPGAQMRLSNDGANWSTQPYANTANWTLAFASGVRTVYAQYADVAGNWTAVKTYTLGGEPDGELVVTPYGPDAARLQWQTVPGVAEYVVLRSDTLGWVGTLELQNDLTGGASTEVIVDSTAGLQPGCELHFRGHREDYYIDEVIDTTHFSLTSPVQRDYTTGHDVNLSGCWVKDYSGYTEIDRVSGTNEYIDTGLSQETDYYYVIGYDYGSGIAAYSIPVNAKPVQTGMLYDAALGASGGYAWKVTQNYGDTPELIDGDADTYSIRIQYSDPTISDTNDVYLGFHRVNLNDQLPVRRVEIAQDMSAGRTQAAHIQLGFDDRTFQAFDLENDPLIVRADAGGYRTYRIPVNKTSAYVAVYVEGVTNPGGSYTIWNKIGVYTDQPIARPVTSAVDVETVDLALDFSQPDGALPTLFGTDEVWNNVQGHETGAMLSSWQHTKDVFNLYRVQTGDTWPHAYGWDHVRLGELAADIDASQLSFTLVNTNTYASELAYGVDLKIGYELMEFISFSGDTLTVQNRGLDHTAVVTHAAGTPVYAYRPVGQILRLQQAIPEFPVIVYTDAYVSGITPIPQDVPVTDTVRASVITITVNQGSYVVGDVIRNGREAFLVQAVDNSNPAEIRLTVRRGYDGTAHESIQHNYPTGDVYKYLNYEPYYEGFKNDPTDPGNYLWDHWDVTWDKVIKEGDAIPWIIVWSPWYATQARGRVAALETISNTRGIENNVIVDEYNATHDDADWWYLLSGDNTLEDDSDIRGNMYEFYHARIYFLTGAAAGKVFFIRSHSGDRLRVVASWDDSSWPVTDPRYIDLYAEGVRPGDAYIVTHSARNSANVAPKYWQYNADVFYNVAHHIREKYSVELAGRPIYMEYYLEPNLGTYGTWTLDAYVDSYNVFADIIRNGRAGLGAGFSEDEVIVGAGAIAGGLNPGVPIPGTDRDYDIALTLVEETEHLDFISHHRYYMGSRVQKRENSWEHWMLRSYAQSLGKQVVIVDSEDSVATAGGTGHEEARHWARLGAHYWEANFINSYGGDYGPLGRLDFIIHFRLYGNGPTSLGMAIPDTDGSPLLDLVYWPIQMYQDHTSTDRHNPDTIVRVVKGGDAYGWVQAMGTVHGETGGKYVHLVNKKDTPIVVDLTVLGAGDVVSGTMVSVVGGGPNQTLGDGFHPLDYQGCNGQGPVIETWIGGFDAILLEPYSANIILLSTEEPHRVYAPLVMRAYDVQLDPVALPISSLRIQ